jgi:hypothetical protein
MSGGDGSKPAREANRMEQQRQAQIQATQRAVNAVFDGPGRQREIDDVVGATRQLYTQDLTRQKGEADRQSTFALARNGQLGGSVQIGQQQVLGEDYARGVLEVDRRARAAGSDLRAADQDARARLIQLATSGLDATTGSRQAAESMRTNLAAGRAASTAGALGDAFSSANRFATRARDDAANRDALYNARRNLYGPSAATSYGQGGGGP